MRKLSEIKGDEAFDAIAEILEPLSVILTDEDVTKEQTRLKKVSIALKKHKGEIITILAILEGTDAEEYAKTVSLASLPRAVIELLSDDELNMLF